MSAADAEAAGPPRSRRLFFALWPDDATRGALVRATRRAVRLSGGRPIGKDRLHVTVAFLGELTALGMERAREVPPIEVGAFDLVLDMLGGSGRVLWLTTRSTPAPLAELERRLWAGLEQQGFLREPRIYRPHVTLARRARLVEEPIDAVPWTVTELALVESLPERRSVHYEVLERWPL